MPTSFQCLECKHYKMLICDAFMDGIPDDILTGDHDHKEPYLGDNGILFESVI